MPEHPIPPWPLITLAVEPKSKADLPRLAAALARLAADDPAFSASTDAETGQSIIGGLSELHLDAKVTALIGMDRLDLHVGAPEVGYRETISRSVEVDHTHKRIGSGGRNQFARLIIRMSPRAIGEDAQFTSGIADRAIPAEFVAGARKGVDEALSAGIVAGFPVVSVNVELRDGAYHQTDSSPAAFEIAARTACREAMFKGGAVLLEPIMMVEVTTPQSHADAVVADMLSRRGRIEGQRPAGETAFVSALAPLSNLFGYENSLRSFTRGRATYQTRYDHYAVTPRIDDDPPAAPALALRP